MSLDFYLECGECGQSHFSANVTHNLGKMAEEAGLYLPLWCPVEGQLAGELVSVIKEGLDKLREKPDHFRQWNPENGWGSYEALLEFAESVANACMQNPRAKVRVWK